MPPLNKKCLHIYRRQHLVDRFSQMESEIDEYPFFQGGILMTNKNSQFLLMDAFSHKVYTSNDPDFKYD